MSKPLLQPDLILTLDGDGTIQDVNVTGDLAADEAESTPEHSLNNWIGQPWASTCESASSAKVERMVSGARESGVCGFSQINQKLPNGSLVLFEFVTVNKSDRLNRMVAIGKNLNTVVSMQRKLISTQQSMESEFWKLRELETRYRTLVSSTADAVIILREPDFQVIDANDQASRLIGLKPGDQTTDLVAPERDKLKLERTLAASKSSGRAPLTILKIGTSQEEWMVRASSYTGNSGIQHMLQFSRHNSRDSRANVSSISGISFSDIIANLPDGMVVINQQNVVTHTNTAFARLINCKSTDDVLGKPFDQWLNTSSGSLRELRSQLGANEMVSDFPTLLQTSSLQTEVNTEADQKVMLSAKHIPSENSTVVLIVVRPAAA